MNDREKWRERVRDICAGGTTWWCKKGPLRILSKLKLTIFLREGFFIILGFLGLKEYLVISLTGVQILSYILREYTTHDKMTYQNINQRGTQIVVLGVVMGRISLITNVGDRVIILRKYTNVYLSNHANPRHQHRKWSREDNKLAPHCSSTGNPIQRGYRKEMIEFWEEYAWFQITIQGLAET